MNHTENLQKRNDVAEKQLKDYGIMLMETKEERKVLFDKYEQLNQQYNDKVETFALEKIKMSRNFYVLLGISLMLLLIVGWLLSPNFLTYFN